MKHSERWRINPAVRLHWLSWDEEQEYILFNAASAQTHVLNELGAAIVRLLEGSALDRAALGEQLLARYPELEMDAELSAALDALLANLNALGLIDPD